MEAVDRVKEEERADSPVQVVMTAPKTIEICTLLEQHRRRALPAEFIHRAIANFRIGGRNDPDEFAQVPCPISRASVLCKATSSSK